MYIIDKNQDYYDYFSHIYGIDKTVTFDRRGSIVLNNKDLLISPITSGGWPWERREHHSYVILEVGYIQYLLCIHNIKFSEDVMYYVYTEVEDYDISIVRKYDEHKHYFGDPITLQSCVIDNWSSYMNKEVDIDSFIKQNSFEESILFKSDFIKNPILKNTKITSLLDSQEIWVNLDNYLSSLNNDKDVSIEMTEEEKAETHGFDRKTSFRNPIK